MAVKYYKIRFMNKILIVIPVLLFTLSSGANAQVYISDTYNNSGSIYDFSNPETITTYALTGVGYVASNAGTYYHYGPASATLTVNGYFNAFNPVNPPAWATPLNPGIDYFQGLDGLKGTAQEIAGTTAPRFGILKLDNGAANAINITNSNGAEVGLRADFTNGITTTIRNNTDIGSLHFLDDAFYTNDNLGDAQHVNGYVSKTGNDAFIFPVGSGTDLRTLAITAPSSVTDKYAVAWIAGDPTTTIDPSGNPGLHPVTAALSPILSVSRIGQWDWIAVNGTGAGLGITVSIPDVSTFAATANLRLVGWNGSMWIDLSGGPAATGNTENNTLSGTMAAGITAIGIGSVNFPLPLTLISFNAAKYSRDTRLSWITAREQHSSHFVIEHSIDGRLYDSIGTVAAAGNTSATINYGYTHYSPAAGTHYYRLKIVDTDGRFTYSAVRVLNFGDSVKILVTPNPAADIVTITGMETGMQLSLIAADGKLAGSYKAASSTLTIPIQQLAAGVYILLVTDNNTVISAGKLLKER